MVSSLELPVIDNFIDASWQQSFSELEMLLKLNQIPYRRNPNLVRGLDYYNGTCFEIKMANAGDPNGAGSVLGPSQNTVLAGGRYDYLASYLLGKG